jgi:hypothetical protein
MILQFQIHGFAANLLSLNFKKTQHIQFITKNNMLTSRKIRYGNTTIPNASHTKFLGLTVDNTLSWKNGTDLLINKLRTACYVFRSVNKYTSHSTMIMVYYCLFHSIMTYGIIFWCSSSHSQKIFKYKRFWFELLWDVAVGTPIDTNSKN